MADRKTGGRKTGCFSVPSFSVSAVPPPPLLGERRQPQRQQRTRARLRHALDTDVALRVELAGVPLQTVAPSRSKLRRKIRRVEVVVELPHAAHLRPQPHIHRPAVQFHQRQQHTRATLRGIVITPQSPSQPSRSTAGPVLPSRPVSLREGGILFSPALPKEVWHSRS